MGKKTTRTRIWTYQEAARTIPYVRKTLGLLRETFIKVWHLHRLDRYDLHGHNTEMEALGDEGTEATKELHRLGIFNYQNPLRGIALFPFVVNYSDGRGGDNMPRPAWFVYKDSRDQIDHFIFADLLTTYKDLYGWEMRVPEEWKKLTATPVLAPKDAHRF